ncbi:hypothetical protein DFH11DRAFT_1600674 [Phellopilus nigrolimitatus]|nr:hypothetical protein DFH11DRAFT_1600674 [Phellopilus nigrolimitatus]
MRRSNLASSARVPPAGRKLLPLNHRALPASGRIEATYTDSALQRGPTHCVAGASVWQYVITDGGLNPDVVLVGIGVELAFELIAAAALLQKDVPVLRVRASWRSSLARRTSTTTGTQPPLRAAGHGAHADRG